MNAASVEGVRVDDLIDGLNEWRNIQDVVRLTFKALHDVVKAQGDAIRSLERQVEQKVSTTDMQSQMANKANVNDVNRSLSEIGKILDQKVSVNDHRRDLGEKMDGSVAQNLLNQKVNLDQVRSEIDKKADSHEILKLLDKNSRDITRMIEETERTVQKTRQDMTRKVDMSQYNEDMDRKANLLDVQAALDAKANAQDVEEALQLKASKQSVVSSLQRKANKAEVEAILDTKANVSDMQTQLQHKADADFVNLNLNKKANHADMIDLLEQQSRDITRDLMKEIQMRATNDEVEKKASLQAVQGWLTNTVERKELSDTITALVKKIDTDVVSRITSVERDLSGRVEQKLERREFLEAHEKLCAADAENHNGLSDLQHSLRTHQVDVEGVLNNYVTKTEHANAMSKKPDRQEVSSQMSVKASIEDVNRVLERKADLSEVNEALSHKAGLNEVNRILDLKMNMDETKMLLAEKASIQDVNLALDLKANRNELKELSDHLVKTTTSVVELNGEITAKAGLEKMEELKRELNLKSNIKDVCALLDMKSNIEDVNVALTAVNKELDAKASLEELARTIQDQTAINESLCSELTVGRWVWKSGETKAGHKVPWNVQTVNTNANNFLWEKDKTTIVCNAPGLYEITFGFFSRKKPTVQLFVNGEIVMSAINSASYVVHHSSGRLAAVDSHSAGNVTGLTLIDFLALPPRARVSLSYNGSEGAEGFIGLRKL